jgi:hypothetical protein
MCCMQVCALLWLPGQAGVLGLMVGLQTQRYSGVLLRTDVQKGVVERSQVRSLTLAQCISPKGAALCDVPMLPNHAACTG